MIPSDWAFYVAAVSAVTRLSPSFILYHLSYARGLQYQVVWWRFFYDPERGVNCEKLTIESSGRTIV